jgi:hypothetical protein
MKNAEDRCEILFLGPIAVAEHIQYITLSRTGGESIMNVFMHLLCIMYRTLSTVSPSKKPDGRA